MPDGRPALTKEEELARERAHLLATLQEGLDDIEAGNVITPDELDAMVEEAFARQEMERGGKR